MMDDAAKKARDEYLKKYISKDDKQLKKKRKKKKSGTGLKIHENDAFVNVAACTEQTSSGDESGKDIEILEKVKALHSIPKFKPAAFKAVELKSNDLLKVIQAYYLTDFFIFAAETNAERQRHDSSSDENDAPHEISLPTTSSKEWESASVINKNCQKNIKQTIGDSNVSFPVHRIKDEPLDSDSSPPRRNPDNDKSHSFSKQKKSTNSVDVDVPQLRCKIKDEPLDSDLSPPKKSVNCTRRSSKGDDSDVSPPRRKKPTNNSDSDLSPPRRHDDYAGISNHRKKFVNYAHQKLRRSDSADSGRYASYDKNRRRKHNGKGWDESHNRHRGRHESHHRRRDSSDDSRASRRSKRDQASDGKAESMTGKSGGLRTLESHREELKRHQEDEKTLLKSWDGYASGEGAAIVRRPKLTGKGRETKEDRERKEREAKKQQELEEKYKNWNKGLRQLEERTQKLDEMARVAQEDFARHADDRTMNEHLKKQLHEKDPMYKYVKKKKENAEIKSGTAYPKYKGSWPPNRFNIAPGYRWDGVNRSNGFEDRIAETTNKKIAQYTEYYENIAKYEV
ncbi:unnamed protein product [Litomosoides sigmodontis]|uniref:BUD13 homolog n=1 Tax=Litomosoides sigmodontis TaxID=42156 RepID=A0A3P6TUC3_LITSI|nr:unnamed protein product [Litomosoides sigmodontis]